MPLSHRADNDIELGQPNSFPGFALPTSNTTYTPNQFFDVCLPYASRGCVRAVAYLIRKTLGWCDEKGEPTASCFNLSYMQLEITAGVGHSSVQAALEQAVSRGFLVQASPPHASSAGRTAASAQFELRWDRGSEYIKAPDSFAGFYEGEGNRTDIPNQYFDVVVPNEPLSVVQVVGAIIRFSIGFQARRGSRRQQALLSYADLRRYTKIKSQRILSSALKRAEAKKYIVRLDRGFFDPDAGKLSRAATYALRWADHPMGTPKSEAAHRSEKGTRSAPKSEAEDHSEKVSGIQMKPINNTFKQQRVPVISNEEGFKMLRAAGFDVRAAVELSDRYPNGRLRRQVDWASQRKASRNRMGMLRRAIEEDWSPPGKRAVGLTQLEPNDSAADQNRRDLLRQQSAELSTRFKL